MGDSTLITRAPASGRSLPTKGPAQRADRSATTSPEQVGNGRSGPAWRDRMPWTVPGRVRGVGRQGLSFAQHGKGEAQELGPGRQLAALESGHPRLQGGPLAGEGRVGNVGAVPAEPPSRPDGPWWLRSTRRRTAAAGKNRHS